MQIGNKTKYGARPHPDDSWGYTRQLLVKRDEADCLDSVIALFSEVGVNDEVAAAKWLVLNLGA